MNIPGFTTIKSKKKNKLFVFKRSLNPIFEFNSGQSLYHISIERRSRLVSHIYKQYRELRVQYAQSFEKETIYYYSTTLKKSIDSHLNDTIKR